MLILITISKKRYIYGFYYYITFFYNILFKYIKKYKFIKKSKRLLKPKVVYITFLFKNNIIIYVIPNYNASLLILNSYIYLRI